MQSASTGTDCRFMLRDTLPIMAASKIGSPKYCAGLTQALCSMSHCQLVFIKMFLKAESNNYRTILISVTMGSTTQHHFVNLYQVLD